MGRLTACCRPLISRSLMRRISSQALRRTSSALLLPPGSSNRLPTRRVRSDAVMPMTARIGMRSAMPFRKQPAILSFAARGIGIEPGDRLAVKTIERFEELTEPFGKMLAAFGQLIRAMRANKDRSDDLDALCEYACEVDLEMAKWGNAFKRLTHPEGEADDASEEAADIPFEGFEDTLVSTDSRVMQTLRKGYPTRLPIPERCCAVDFRSAFEPAVQQYAAQVCR